MMIALLKMPSRSEGREMQIHCSACNGFVECDDSAAALATQCPSCGTVVDSGVSVATAVAERPRILSHFELIEPVGGGHYGDVWMARDLELQRVVALKIPRIGEMDPEAVALFLREARTAATLKHPNIVPVHEVGRDGATAYIATDFIPGETLAARLKVQRPTPHQAARLCVKIADALQHAHEKGVIHRDVKPGNIMIDEDGQPHVMDFGLAKRDGAESTIAVMGEILGTAAYMPPEQARGDAWYADARSDVYSLGMILYELLAGERPFRGEMSLVLHKVISEEPPPPRSINPAAPRDLETICLKAITKNPAGRYSTAKDMAADLRRYLSGEPVLANRPGKLQQFGRRLWKHAAVNASLGIAFVAVFLAAFSYVRPPVEGTSGDSAPWRKLPASEPTLAVSATTPRKALFPSATVRLETNPAGAKVYFVRLHEATGEPDPATITKAPGVSPVESPLEPGDYLVVVVHPEGFHEVFRRVPRPGERSGQYWHNSWERNADGTVQLPRVNGVRPADFAKGRDMALIRGSDRFEMGAVGSKKRAKHIRRVPSFYLQCREVTVGYVEKGTRLRWEPGPNCSGEPRTADDPITCITWDQAVWLAESQMMRLPTEAEYEFAATRGGRTKFPWGNDGDRLARWRFGHAGEPAEDRLDVAGSRPVYGLYSNVAEWTMSRYSPLLTRGGEFQPGEHGPDKRTVRGGPIGVATGEATGAAPFAGPRERFGYSRFRRLPKLGFRFARSVKPRVRAEDFESWLRAL